MSLIINHNLTALTAHRNLSASASGMSKSIEKLSSGYKINIGADDPSGLIISEQLRSQVSGLERAIRNSSEAFNLIGIAEGALNEMNTILKKMRALAIHASNNGITSPEQIAADQAEMDSGIQTLDRIANTTRYSDQYLLNGQKELVYDVNTVVNEPTDHALLDTKMTRVDQIFKRDGVKMSVGFTGSSSNYKANTDNSAQRAYLEADAAYSLSEINGANVTGRQEFILTGTGGSRLFSFKAGTHVGTIVDAINNVKDSTGIGAAMTFASDVRIDQSTNGIFPGGAPDYGPPPVPATGIPGYDDGTYVYQNGDIQIYGAGLNNADTSKIEEFCITPDAADAFKVGYNCDGDGKIYAKIIDKSTNSIEYYKDKECTMLIGKGDDRFFAATNNSDIPSAPTQNLDGIFIKLNADNVDDLDVFEIAVVGQRLDNMKDLAVDGLGGWCDLDNSIMSGVDLGNNTGPEGQLYFKYTPLTFEDDGETVRTFKVEVFTHSSREPQYLVATSGEVLNNLNIPTTPPPYPPQIAGQTVRVESWNDSGLNITLNLPKPGMIEAAIESVANGLIASGTAGYDAAFDAINQLYLSEVANFETVRDSVLASGALATAGDLATFTAAVVASGGTATMAENLNAAMIRAFEEYIQKGMTTPSFSDYLEQQAMGSSAYAQLRNVSPGAVAAADQYIADFIAAYGDPATSGDLAEQYKTAYDDMQTATQARHSYLTSGAAATQTRAAVMLEMPKGMDVGQVDFTNLGMRIFAVGYGSAETIRIQNNAGNLFYQYRENDTLEKVMVKPNTTVQVAGQDAQISLNGAPIFTTGLIANTTTPDFSGQLVFNAGRLGCPTLAVTGYDTGKLFSRATTLQGIEENEAKIAENRRHFEPPSLNVTMGAQNAANIMEGMLDKSGKPVNLYLDFSQLDSTVQVKINHLGDPSAIKMDYTGGRLRIDATALGIQSIVDIPVSPENLEQGFYLTEPALKGLYIKTDVLVDLNKSAHPYSPPDQEITATAGNILLEVNTYATNPRGNTTESMSNFKGGMQFQLGNTEGDQDRTIYSIQSMAMSNLGRINWNGNEYCLQDVLGGGLASLTKDPVLAMRVIGQAVDDVSTLRARLGAFQSNMLQTNINSLEVAVENITKTEAAIRDTDMAAEATQFTRFQIMQQAGTSMLAQANQVSQNVLALLQ